jgi:hypothetical protein
MAAKRRKSRVCLICRDCGGETDYIWGWRYCGNCWYALTGGDLSPDELWQIPSAWLT